MVRQPSPPPTSVENNAGWFAWVSRFASPVMAHAANVITGTRKFPIAASASGKQSFSYPCPGAKERTRAGKTFLSLPANIATHFTTHAASFAHASLLTLDSFVLRKCAAFRVKRVAAGPPAIRSSGRNPSQVS